ncbi:Glucosyl-3-phosphoglycerate phosphatase [Austwickia sp. TVS 96-490-7B]|uniref:histidine phosphatase family protein n=1 Tax=Austwickia sp. TVS 96-490-7B TaxID=2830843 RepID=UPI001C59BEB7|nr:histidine phosphatase family protein [Austwickia sp. TVS 96-490-7B]MBW3084431.1 Glucosyl-3-phosphoglycerate phosphatase [Austwickia sp. TVS 96-490-7B]
MSVAATSMPRRVVLLRHGVTTHNARGLWQGHLNTPLSPTGLDQARRVAPVLAGYGLAGIWASDLDRASRTARIVADHADMSVTVDARLREIGVGHWQGRDAADVEKASPGVLARLAAGEDVRRGGHGETVAEVVRRARPSLDEVIATLHPGQTALVVTHGVCARALAADLVGMDQRTAWLCLSGLGNCHWGELVHVGDRWRIAVWNGQVDRPGPPTRPAHGY